MGVLRQVSEEQGKRAQHRIVCCIFLHEHQSVVQNSALHVFIHLMQFLPYVLLYCLH